MIDWQSVRLYLSVGLCLPSVHQSICLSVCLSVCLSGRTKTQTTQTADCRLQTADGADRADWVIFSSFFFFTVRFTKLLTNGFQSLSSFEIRELRWLFHYVVVNQIANFEMKLWISRAAKLAGWEVCKIDFAHLLCVARLSCTYTKNTNRVGLTLWFHFNRVKFNTKKR